MAIDENILKNDERVSLTLRSLYSRSGYTLYKMGKFEEYDLYMRNKDFLVSDGIITFTDTNGKLLALKPDVTLSIVKNSQDEKGRVQKVYYNENVYRISGSSHTYKEIMQTGLECTGDLTADDVHEVAALAAESLKLIDQNGILSLSHVGLVTEMLLECGFEKTQHRAVIEAVTQKNAGLLKQLCSGEQFEVLKLLLVSYNDAHLALKRIGAVIKSDAAKNALEELADVCGTLSGSGFASNINIDFSIVDASGYYSGIIFKGYANGAESAILSGGRYDMLMRKMGRTAGALGFAVYLDALERLEEPENTDSTFINVALPKGRLGEKVYELFEKAGFDCPAIKENNRKLIFENIANGIRFFWVKPSDVSIYVERGAADIGVVGKDILLEYEPDVYELLDMNLGKCRMAVAAKKDFCDDTSKTLRVATKFSNIARSYYAEKCRDIDIIHLNGSIEIAPILGLSDVIVDIVETGKTLLENDLEPREDIVNISARLISNKAAYKFKSEKIEQIKSGLLEQVRQEK